MWFRSNYVGFLWISAGNDPRITSHIHAYGWTFSSRVKVSFTIITSFIITNDVFESIRRPMIFMFNINCPKNNLWFKKWMTVKRWKRDFQNLCNHNQVFDFVIACTKKKKTSLLEDWLLVQLKRYKNRNMRSVRILRHWLQ